jgi:hypothetical protein
MAYGSGSASLGTDRGGAGRVGSGKPRRKLPGAVAEMGPGYLKRFGWRRSQDRRDCIDNVSSS